MSMIEKGARPPTTKLGARPPNPCKSKEDAPPPPTKIVQTDLLLRGPLRTPPLESHDSQLHNAEKIASNGPL